MSAAGGEQGAQSTIRGMIHRIAHTLPAQAPLTEFIHHNTLHADQHLGFHAAIALASARSGAQGYPSAATLRAAWRSGRIRPGALEEALADHPELLPEGIALPLPGAPLTRGRLCALLLGAESGDDPAPPGFLLRRLARMGAGERALWEACAAQAGLSGPEQGGPEQGGPAGGAMDREPEAQDRQQAAAMAQESLARSFDAPIPPAERIASICGADLLAGVAPEVIPFAAAALDEGQAGVAPAGLYRAWREAQAAAQGDRAEVVWPDDPESLLAARLESLPAAHREPVLERIAWRCPGWAGMIAWREAHPDWPPQAAAPVRLAEWLAVWWAEEERLAARLAARHWGLPPEALAAALSRCPEEFWCRRLLYAGELPEPLADRARYAAGRIHDAPQAAWRTLAAAIYAAIFRPDRPGARLRRAGTWLWPAFRLLLSAGAGAADVAALPAGSLGRLCDLLPALRSQVFGPVGLEAFEADYRRGVVGLLRAAPPDDPGLPGAPTDPADPDGAAGVRAVPDAQVVFCIDEREEAFRRHLERAGADLGLRLETFGAAGFFGLPMNHLPLHADRPVPLCPPAIRPDRTVREIPDDPAEADRQRRLRRRIGRLAQEARAPWLLPLLPLFAPLLLGWIGLMIAAPAQLRRITAPILQRLLPPIPTRQTLDPDPADPDVGFSPEEQADRLARLFTQIGLGRSGQIPGPAPLVLLLAHGSSSLNNPHRAAYACGACGGRHGGPNARAVATLANRPDVRQMLRTRGVHIPDGTVFLAGEHDTGSEEIVFFDTGPAPDPAERPGSHALRAALQTARAASAQERCRRFASAPVAPGGGPPDAQAALRHVDARTWDIGQARPELGHATNAAAIIGRRSRSRGISLDRRSFLVSYDPTADPGGSVLEGILLAVGPVGAGISLEYYFSSVDPERFGCGSKLPHNLQGRFAVMEGTEGDLRTGLPRQMTELHEPMRLLMIVEAAPAVLGAILARQPALRELIDGEWVQLLALSPGGADLLRYRPGHGFSPCN